MNRARVYFCISGGAFEPDDLTRRIGVTPTGSWRQGEKAGGSQQGGRPIPAWSQWEFGSAEVADACPDVYALSRSVVEKLSGKAAIIADVTKELGLWSVLQVVLHISTDEQVPTPILALILQSLHFWLAWALRSMWTRTAASASNPAR